MPIQHLGNLVITFHIKSLEKQIANFPFINSIFILVKLIIRSTIKSKVLKQKHCRPIKISTANNYIKKS